MSDLLDSTTSEVTSPAPESTTSEETTSAPESTTSEETTSAAESTTSEETTSAPESTSSGETTSASESTTSEDTTLSEDSTNEEDSLSADYVGTTTITNYYVPEASLDSVAIDTFDRIIDTIPSYYGYLAYKVSDTQYILLTGSEYSVSGYTVTFGSDCILSTVTQADSDFDFSTYCLSNQSYSVSDQELVYTNMISGFPSLGSHSLEYAPFFGLGLIVVVLGAVFTRNSRR